MLLKYANNILKYIFSLQTGGKLTTIIRLFWAKKFSPCGTGLLHRAWRPSIRLHAVLAAHQTREPKRPYPGQLGVHADDVNNFPRSAVWEGAHQGNGGADLHDFFFAF